MKKIKRKKRKAQVITRKPAFKLTIFDRLIGLVSPRTALVRAEYRAKTAGLVRKYEGADSGRRTEGWVAHGTSANTEIKAALFKLRNRSRDLLRNNPYAKNGVRTIVNEVIGTGIVVKMRDTNSTSQTAKEKRLNKLWKAWAETTACDFERKKDLAAIQASIMHAVVESGDVLLRFRREPVRKVRYKGELVEVPAFSLQILESDFLVNTIDIFSKAENGNEVKQGIELDDTGRVVAYHVYKNHPGDRGFYTIGNLETIRIPAEEMLLIGDEQRANALRSVPWLAPVMLRLRDFDLFEDATLKRQQCAAMFTAFVHDDEADVDDLPSGVDPEVVELAERMEPGMIELLPANKRVTLSSPPGADGYSGYSMTVLRSIGAGLGITYEALVGDLGQINFSSGRMGRLQMQRNAKVWRKFIMLNQVLKPIVSEFYNEAEILGYSTRGIFEQFIPPRVELIEPNKETQADKNEVRSGFKTLSTVIMERGHDPEEHLLAMQKDNELLDKYGLVLDSDGRQGKGDSSSEKEPSNNKGKSTEDDDD